MVRIDDGPKGLALTADVTPRYCRADPVEGGKQAVAEAWRNLTAVGAVPLALTDNLNFGNPEKPEAMGELVGCIRGIGEAAGALAFPIVSGNVSLYNETMGQGIMPTPTIGGVGLLADVTRVAASRFEHAGHVLLLVGHMRGWLGQSLYLRDICARAEGAPPPVDLAAERRNGDFVRDLIAGGVRAVHDLSDGGLAVAVAGDGDARRGSVRPWRPMPRRASPRTAFSSARTRAATCSRCRPKRFRRSSGRRMPRGVPARTIGVTGGDALTLPCGTAILVSELRAAHERFLPDLMEGSR